MLGEQVVTRNYSGEGEVPPAGVEYGDSGKHEPVAEVSDAAEGVVVESLTPEVNFKNSGRLLVALSRN